MFNLDEAVEQWSRSMDLSGCGRQDHLEELQDHLYCEIGRLQEEGHSPELAFLKATQQLGNLGDLSAEYAKNKGLLELLCAAEAKPAGATSGTTPHKASAVMLAHSILFAAAMLATPLLISDNNDASSVLFLLLVPLWFATFMLLPGMRHAAGCEWQAVQRLFGAGR